jgi:hypothetical protein
MSSFSYQESYESNSNSFGNTADSNAAFTSAGGDFGGAQFSYSSGGSSGYGGSAGASGNTNLTGTSSQIAADIISWGRGLNSSSNQSSVVTSTTTYGSSGAASGFGSSGAAGAAGASLIGASFGGSSGSYTSSVGAGFGGGASSSLTVTSTGAANQVVLSQVEAAILRSTVPIDINETEEITIQGQRGIWANKQEVVNWKGVIPISEYIINEDSNPEIITKKTQQNIEYIQELAIRYLRPPTPPAPGEIIITQEINSLVPPAPPLVIRQQPARPSTPEPLVIREAPPQPPAQVGRKVITISGKRLPPPPRKVIIERLAPLPSKPQSVIIERWLPYSEVKRRVIFQKNNQPDAVFVKPKNVIIQWEAPQVTIKKEFKYLGVIRANPAEYVQRYGTTLKQSRELPDFVLDIKAPQGVVLAADYKYNEVHELEGELQAFKLVDLEKEGLTQYRAQLQKLGIISGSASSTSFSQITSSTSQGASFGASTGFGGSGSFGASGALGLASGASVSSFNAGGASGSFGAASGSLGGSAGFGSGSASSAVSGLISQLFSSIDYNSNGRISVEECEKVIQTINQRLGRSYGDADIKAFFGSLDIDRDGTITLQEFKRAFERLL